ncbi:MAG: PqqD family protein [Clostridiales bacterium]|nr:PqqD family protein [Clostridiales bacterium]
MRLKRFLKKRLFLGLSLKLLCLKTKRILKVLYPFLIVYLIFLVIFLNVIFPLRLLTLRIKLFWRIIMKIKDGFVVRNVGEKILVVPVGDRTASFNGMLVLNDMAKFFWDNLQNDIEIDELVNIVCQNYDVSFDVAKNDILEFTDKLQKAGILE